MSKNVVISCENLSKVFNEGKLKTKVLHNISLSVRAQEKLAIVGASGSGKSTLLHLLGGLDLPTTGTVTLCGQNLNKLSVNKRSILRNQHLGFVYQFHHLLPEFTALENVAMPLLLRGESVNTAKLAAQNILDRVNLKHRISHKPSELSGGERQRVAIARALVTKPSCILADEPTGNLDSSTEDMVYGLMQELNQEFAIALILVTHNKALAKKADRVLMMADGCLIV